MAMLPEGMNRIEAIIEAAEPSAIAVCAFVVGRADARVPLAVELQIVATETFRPSGVVRP